MFQLKCYNCECVCPDACGKFGVKLGIRTGRQGTGVGGWIRCCNENESRVIPERRHYPYHDTWLFKHLKLFKHSVQFFCSMTKGRADAATYIKTVLWSLDSHLEQGKSCSLKCLRSDSE